MNAAHSQGTRLQLQTAPGGLAVLHMAHDALLLGRQRSKCLPVGAELDARDNECQRGNISLRLLESQKLPRSSARASKVIMSVNTALRTFSILSTGS